MLVCFNWRELVRYVIFAVLGAAVDDELAARFARARGLPLVQIENFLVLRRLARVHDVLSFLM